MKSKFIYILSLLSILLFFLAGCGKNDNESNVTNTASANRMSTEISINNSTNNLSNITESTTNELSNTTENTVNEIRVGLHEVENTEEELGSFSTKLGGKDTPRTRNIGITTSILNETIVENGETFSFCGTIGNPTADMGYEEADSFDADGNTVKTLGGGNCQVSSTLYNVVLQIEDLEVKERHAHIKPVHYVEKDKDATVAYGSVDFKFKNNTGSKIKIYASSDLNSVNVRIVKL